MAQVIKVNQGTRTLWMLRGKVGDRVYQVRNGQQIITKLPRRRSTLPSEREQMVRARFKAVIDSCKVMSAEERSRYEAAWERGGYKYKGKKYYTLQGYIFANLYSALSISTDAERAGV